MTLKSLEWVAEALKDRKLSVVAEKTNLSVQTLRAIRDGKNTSPTYGTWSELSNYLTGDSK